MKPIKRPSPCCAVELRVARIVATTIVFRCEKCGEHWEAPPQIEQQPRARIA